MRLDLNTLDETEAVSDQQGGNFHSIYKSSGYLIMGDNNVHCICF